MSDTDVIEEEVDTEEEEVLCDLCGDEEDVCACVVCNHCAEKSNDYDLCSICEGAHGWCCSCCAECGSSECECCGDCCNSPCTCNGDSFGYSPRPAWEDRGKNPESQAYNATSNWQMIWPEIDAPNFDLCQQAADFYLLEAITNGLVNSANGCFLPIGPVAASPEQLLVLIGADDPRIVQYLENKRAPEVEAATGGPSVLERTMSGIMRDARALYTRKIDTADNILRAYFHMAVAGEARHHQALKNRVLSHDRDRAWSGWRSIYDQIGPEALLDLAALFYEFEGGTYGGTPWANACEILHSREMGTLGPTPEMNKKMFIDRAWTLEHNGGCFLNKITWGVHNDAGWNMGNLKEKVLNSHAANPVRWRLLLKAASHEVRTMFDQAWEINNEINGTDNLHPLNAAQANRKMCRQCESNPEFGHYVNCKVKRFFPDFDGDTSKPQNWCYNVDEDDFEEYNWHRWEQTSAEAFYGPMMEILHPESPVNVSFQPHVKVLIEPKDLTGSDHVVGYTTYYWCDIAQHMEIPIGEIEGFVFDPTNWLENVKSDVKEQAIRYWNELNAPGLTEKDLRVTFTEANFHIRHPLANETFIISDPYKESKKKNKYTLQTTA